MTSPRYPDQGNDDRLPRPTHAPTRRGGTYRRGESYIGNKMGADDEAAGDLGGPLRDWDLSPDEARMLGLFTWDAGFDPNRPTGGGNISPTYEIDTSRASTNSGPLFPGLVEGHDYLRPPQSGPPQFNPVPPQPLPPAQSPVIDFDMAQKEAEIKAQAEAEAARQGQRIHWTETTWWLHDQ